MQEAIGDFQAALNPTDDDQRTPGRALMILCKRFLEQHPIDIEDEDDLTFPDKEAEERDRKRLEQMRTALQVERNTLLDEIAENINNQPGWPTYYPKTAKELLWTIYGLLDASGNEAQALEMLGQMDQFDLDGETLEGFAAELAD
jgi:hypothetical protein